MPAIPLHLTTDTARLARRVAGPEPLPEPFAPSLRQSELHQFAKRQGTIAIPALYQNQNDSPAPGAVVGIVLGSVAGFLLLFWLFSTLTSRPQGAVVAEEEVVVSSRRSRSPRSRRSRRTEMRSRSPRRERIIRQERIVRDTSRAPPPRPVYVEEEVRPPPERDNRGGDIVEVFEEESSIASAPRRKSKRGSRYG